MDTPVKNNDMSHSEIKCKVVVTPVIVRHALPITSKKKFEYLAKCFNSFIPPTQRLRYDHTNEEGYTEPTDEGWESPETILARTPKDQADEKKQEMIRIGFLMRGMLR